MTRFIVGNQPRTRLIRFSVRLSFEIESRLLSKTETRTLFMPAAAPKRANKAMTPTQFRQLAERLPPHMTTNQAALGEYLGRNPYTISGYGTGRVPIPAEIANLIRCLVALHAAGMLDDLEDQLEKKVSLVT